VSILENAESRVPQTFLDMVSEVKPWLQIPANDTSRDFQLRLIIDMACAWACNYIGRPIGPTTYDRRFDGWANWNGAYIMLPFYPVLEVTSVIEYWGIAGPHVLVESTPTVQVDGWQCVYNTGRLNRVFPGNVQKPWFPGSRNIEVVWTAGFNPIPADIKVAVLELIAHWFRNTQQMGGRPSNAINAAAEFEPADQSGLWAGIPYRCTALLAPFLSIGIG
jgi:hypothetical protein